MTWDEYIECMIDNNYYMENAAQTDAERSEDPYVIIYSIPDGLHSGESSGLLFFVNAELKGRVAIYATTEYRMYNYDYIHEQYEPDFAGTFPFTDDYLERMIPEIVRKRKIVCYNSSTVIPMIQTIMENANKPFESEVCDVKSEAKRILGTIPDYQICTILDSLGHDEDTEFPNNEAIEMLYKIKMIYDELKEIENAEY